MSLSRFPKLRLPFLQNRCEHPLPEAIRIWVWLSALGNTRIFQFVIALMLGAKLSFGETAAVLSVWALATIAAQLPLGWIGDRRPGNGLAVKIGAWAFLLEAVLLMIFFLGWLPPLVAALGNRIVAGIADAGLGGAAEAYAYGSLGSATPEQRSTCWEKALRRQWQGRGVALLSAGLIGMPLVAIQPVPGSLWIIVILNSLLALVCLRLTRKMTTASAARHGNPVTEGEGPQSPTVVTGDSLQTSSAWLVILLFVPGTLVIGQTDATTTLSSALYAHCGLGVDGWMAAAMLSSLMVILAPSIAGSLFSGPRAVTCLGTGIFLLALLACHYGASFPLVVVFSIVLIRACGVGVRFRLSQIVNENCPGRIRARLIGLREVFCSLFEFAIGARIAALASDQDAFTALERVTLLEVLPLAVCCGILGGIVSASATLRAIRTRLRLHLMLVLLDWEVVKRPAIDEFVTAVYKAISR